MLRVIWNMCVFISFPQLVYYFFFITISCMRRLQVEDNLTVLLLSELVWDTFRPNTGCLEPLPLHFPDYTKGLFLSPSSHCISM